MAEQKLGKGLGALFGGGFTLDDELTPEEPHAAKDTGTAGAQMIPISQIDNNIDQPRKDFNADALAELSDSIKKHGVIQPILVTPIGSRYMIVAGERRWRASKMAGLKEIPALVKMFNVKQIAEIAIIENLQRDDLNDMELARGIKKLMDEHALTQEKVAERLGKPRSTIANMLRLTGLPSAIQKMIEQKTLTSGHAIRLLSVPHEAEQIRFATQAASAELSVRELADLIDGKVDEGKLFDVKHFGKSGGTVKPPKAPEIREQEKILSRAAGTKVKIDGTIHSGKVVLAYYSSEELDRIVDFLLKHKM